MACCPFHQEKTPSFSVNPSKKIFYCFGCSKGGSVFNFIMELEGVSFPDAVLIVAEKSGVPLPALEDDQEHEEVLDEDPISEAEPPKVIGHAVSNSCVFIGHGRSALWARLQLFLEKELCLETITFESEPRAGESTVPALEKMLGQATFAVLILTAEDETIDGKRRARQNVVHEAGLFQGRLGFRKAILLVQDGLEDFTNIAGLQHIPFSSNKIEQTFYELQRVLKREGLLK